MTLTTHLIHHATLFVHPERKKFSETLWNDLRNDSLAHIFHDHTVVDIDTARQLTSWANAPYEGERVALLSFHTITLPAQNALLKILEEPRVGVRFILVTTNQEALIPTLLSRLQLQSLPLQEVLYKKEATLFLATPHKERMKLASVTSLLNATDEEKRKDREGVKLFILSIATLLGTKQELHKETQEVLEVASYASDPSSSGKALLEYISLIVPVIK